MRLRHSLVYSDGKAQCRCRCGCCGRPPISREREAEALETLWAGTSERATVSHLTNRTPSHVSFGRSHPRLDVHHKLGIVGVLFLAVLVFLLVYVASLPPGWLTASPGRPAPVFGLPLLGSGDQYGTPELKGKLVIVTFWASWCEPCSIDARLLEDVWRRYRDRGLLVLGVNLDAVESDALAFVRRHEITYPNVQDVGTVAGAFGLAGVPETYFLDENWTVSSVYRGYELEVDRSHGVVLQDALYQPILERRVEALFAGRSGARARSTRSRVRLRSGEVGRSEGSRTSDIRSPRSTSGSAQNGRVSRAVKCRRRRFSPTWRRNPPLRTNRRRLGSP